MRTRFTPQVLIADNTLITIFARSETCKLAAFDITRRISRAENGLATRPIVTVEEILLNDSWLLPSFKDEGSKLMALLHLYNASCCFSLKKLSSLDVDSSASEI